MQSYLNGAFDRDGKRLNEGEPATDLEELIVNSAEDVKRLVHFRFSNSACQIFGWYKLGLSRPFPQIRNIGIFGYLAIQVFGKIYFSVYEAFLGFQL